MSQTVIGMFESSSKAQAAVNELVESGISRDSIDISGSNSGSLSSSATSNVSDETHEGESGISKFFKSLFGDDDHDADKYSTVASRSQSIVTVHLHDSGSAEKVADILDDNGAVNVDEHAAKYGYSNTTGSTVGSGVSDLASGAAGVAGAGLSGLGTTASTVTGLASTTGGADYPVTSGSAYTGSASDDFSKDASGKINVIEENLEVGKREIQTGGVRLRSRIIERPVEESVRLREERVSIERTPVDRVASTEDLKNFQERNIELVEYAEVPVVNKSARVVEEISVGKEVEERNETIKDTVRKTEVDVENLESNDKLNRLNTKTDNTSNSIL